MERGGEVLRALTFDSVGKGQELGDAPGLGDASFRFMRRVAVEDFRNRADGAFLKVFFKSGENPP